MKWRTTAQRKTRRSVLNNPMLTLQQGRHEQALTFGPVEKRKEWVDAQRKRHNVWMPR